jgi:uncharacterized membrane protein
MWFLGLIVGAIIGAIGGGAGAVIGALIGAVIGWSMSQKSKAAANEMIEKIEDAVRQLSERVAALERGLAPSKAAVPARTPEADLTAGTTEEPASTQPAQPPLSPAAAAFADTSADVMVSVTVIARPADAEGNAVPGVEEYAGAAERATPAPEPPATSESPGQPTVGSWWQRVIRGNIVAKVGVVVLFFGVGFLLKFAYDHGLLPVPLRLAGVALAGLGMVYGGWRLQATRRLYGLILQGGGFGLLYLDVFFALKVFAVLHPVPAFALFMMIGVAMTLAAVRNEAKPLAVLGLVGAFLAPLLAGTREGNHVVLFSYYTLLNGFILAISWFKAWRDLNLVGFFFTFTVGLLWGYNSYRPELFATVQPFVLIFFAMYLVIPILFAQRQPPELRGLVDGTLVFGTPLATAFMQAALAREMPYGLAVSSGCATLLYGVLAVLTLRREGMRLLSETYAALAVVFVTLTIFFALDAYPTFALWTLEGAAIVWVGLRQRRLLARIFGVALQGAGAIYFLAHYRTYDLANPWFNDFVLGCAFVAVAGWLTSWLMHKHREVLVEGGKSAAAAVLVWGCGWWFAGGVHALHHGMASAHFLAAALPFGAASFAAAEWIGARLQWPTLRLVAALHLPALVLAMLYLLGDRAAHPLAGYGALSWPLTFVVYYWCLHRRQRDGLMDLHAVCYRGGWVLMALLATWEVVWQLDHGRYLWALAWSALGIVVGYVRFHLRERNNPEAKPIGVAALVWGLFFWFASGLSYIDQELGARVSTTAGLGFVAASCVLFEVTGSAGAWRALRRAAMILPVAMAVALVKQFADRSHPFDEFGWLSWLAAFVVLYATLARHERDAVAVLDDVQHVLALWLAILVLTWETSWQLDAFGFGNAWPRAVWGVIPAVALAWVSSYRGRKAWPFGIRFALYRDTGLLPFGIFAALWTLYANFSQPGSMAPVPYLPLLNPIDLAQAAIVYGLLRWIAAFGDESAVSKIRLAPFVGGLVFLWVNCIVLRSIHYWAGVDYAVDALVKSVLVQSAFSLLWTATALVLMVHATRSARRKLWITGALLLGVVVIKLFLNDLGNTGTVARIVSFLGVGALLMVIGYVAPVPPGEQERREG